MSGKLIVISAPSGAGKTTIVKALLQADLDLEFSISACSRPKRHNESNGLDYYFMDVDQFKKQIAEDRFIEWEEVYHDQFYGTLRSELERIWSNGHHVIFDVDVMGGLNIKRQYPENSLAIFIQPPTIETLAERLKGRLTEDNESLNKRLSKAELEMSYATQFDQIIVNDNLDLAVKKAIGITREFLLDNK